MKNNTYNKIIKYIVKYAVWFALVFIFLFLFDFILKLLVYKPSEIGKPGKSYGLFGFRSLPNPSTTFFALIGIDVKLIYRIILNYFLFMVFIVSSFFVKKKIKLIFLAVISAGILGNAVDVSKYEYVRDVIYIPWLDLGTFNLADIFIFGGVILFSISTILSTNSWKKIPKKKTNKSDGKDENNVKNYE